MLTIRTILTILTWYDCTYHPYQVAALLLIFTIAMLVQLIVTLGTCSRCSAVVAESSN